MYCLTGSEKLIESYQKNVKGMDLEQIKNRLEQLNSEVMGLKDIFKNLSVSVSRKKFHDKDLIDMKSRLGRLNSLEEQFIALSNENKRLRREIDMLQSYQMETVSAESLAIISSRLVELEKKIVNIEKIYKEPRPVIIE